MADKQEKDLLEIAASWVRSLDSNGNSGKTSLYNLLSGVFMYRGTVEWGNEEAINKVFNTGFYIHHDSIYGTSSGHGIFLVLNSGTYAAQLILSNKGILYMRFYHGNGPWGEWKSISFI